MQQNPSNETSLIAALTGSDASGRKEALRALFGHQALRKQAIAHVRRYGGNLQDGEDVFQEAVIVFDRKVRQGAFQGQGSLAAYFMGIVRWFWYNQQQRNGRLTLSGNEIIPEAPTDGDPELEYLLQERRDQIDGLLEKLNDKCRDILKMYQMDYSMEEIARAMHYANAGVAKKEAFLCRKRFRALVKTVPELWRDQSKHKSNERDDT